MRSSSVLARLALGTSLGVALVVLPSTALAGDPCPIDFTFYDVGPPEWLDRDQLLGALTSKDSWVGISFGSSKTGIVVKAVSDGSPAAKAGLKVKDVITSFDGVAITDHKVAGELFRETHPGVTMALKVSRDGAEVAMQLTLGAQDPVVGALIDTASARECSDVSRANVSPTRANEIRAAAFSKARRFRCKDAHKALAKAGLEGGEFVVVRGSKRILIANAGWATTCVAAADLDGARLTPKAVGKVLDKVAKRYVGDRHDNP